MPQNPLIVNFYIDAFNFYHRIDKYQELHGICYKWLNYKSLCESLLLTGQKLGTIYFFTAVTNSNDHHANRKFRKGAADRHQKYIKALRKYGIKIIQGYFKYDPKKNRHEEKQTDSNIVAHMIEDAFNNKFDIAFVLSADSDIVPAVKVIKRNIATKDKKIIITPPPFEGRDIKNNPLGIHGISNFVSICDHQRNIHFNDLKAHLLPEKIYDKNGNLIVERPTEYKPNI
jgi:uncharacterized LabA/DUF88 family protein